MNFKVLDPKIEKSANMMMYLVKKNTL